MIYRSPFWLPRKPRKFIRDNILNGSFAFPTAVPEEVKPLIHGLLKVNEGVRYDNCHDYCLMLMLMHAALAHAALPCHRSDRQRRLE